MFFFKWENIKQTWIMLYIIINFSLWKNKKMFFLKWENIKQNMNYVIHYH